MHCHFSLSGLPVVCHAQNWGFLYQEHKKMAKFEFVDSCNLGLEIFELHISGIPKTQPRHQ